MIIKTTALVVSNELVAENIYRMEILSPEISRNAKPGQFINIKISENFDPFLPRPFSIYNTIEDKIQIIFNAIGKGTKILSTFKAGASINIFGPLGRGFNIADEFDIAVVVAGGLGIAPFPFLTKILKEKNKKIISFVGAKTKNQIVTDGLENIKIATDDGSLGYKGTIIEFLKSNILNMNLTSSLSTFKIFGCGPNPMLKALVNLCNELKINCEISVETQMACGTGLCRGCAVRSKDGNYKLACKDGPVFNSNEIILW